MERGPSLSLTEGLRHFPRILQSWKETAWLPKKEFSLMGLILLTQPAPSLGVSFSSPCPQGTLAYSGGRGIKQKDKGEVPPHYPKGDPFRRTSWNLGAPFPLSRVVLCRDGLGQSSPDRALREG